MILKRPKAWIHATRLRTFDTSPFIAQQREAYEICGLDWDASHKLVDAFFEARDEARRNSSQHYEIAAGLVLSGQVKRILEIGTERGLFAAFLQWLSPDVRVTTVDLPSTHERYVSATTLNRAQRDGRKQKDIAEAQSNTATERRRNIEHLERVTFWEMSSVGLSVVNEKFDLIFVDGDHTYPVVAVDATNALRLVEKHGWILFDDVTGHHSNHSLFHGSETATLLDLFSESGVMSVTRFHKRLEGAMLIDINYRKYIALAQLRSADS